MDELRDSLRGAELEVQWRQLPVRDWTPGKGQVRFLPLETALAALASFVVTRDRPWGLVLSHQGLAPAGPGR